MNASASPSTLPIAPLAAQLAAAPVLLAPYYGVLTPQRLDAPEVEWAALTAGAAIHDLSWLRRFAVRGEDRFRWLNGMVTNTVSGLSTNCGAWNLVLTAQGRIQGDLTVWREGVEAESDTLELEIAADQTEKLLSHLDRFIIMDDVELIPLEAEFALGLTGPKVAPVLKQLGLSVLADPLRRQRVAWKGEPILIQRVYGVQAEHYEIWARAEVLSELWQVLTVVGAVPVGAAALEMLRVAEAVPTYGIDMVERDLPQETAQMRALHFDKGCYQGQEIVERIRSRGSVHRHLRSIEIEGPLPVAGVELSYTNAAGAAVAAGVMASAVELPTGQRLALAMIRAEAEIRPQPLRYAVDGVEGAARILHTPPVLAAQEK